MRKFYVTVELGLVVEADDETGAAEFTEQLLGRVKRIDWPGNIWGENVDFVEVADATIVSRGLIKEITE